MIFRPIADDDIPAVIDLWTRCGLTRPWNDPHRDIAFARGKSNSDVLVGERGGHILASVMLGHDGHRGTLYYLAVEPAAQRSGLGRATVAAAEDWLRARGVWKINILIREGNGAVRGFYESLGYEFNEAFSMGRWLS
jgi:hypothetical protein